MEIKMPRFTLQLERFSESKVHKSKGGSCPASVKSGHAIKPREERLRISSRATSSLPKQTQDLHVPTTVATLGILRASQSLWFFNVAFLVPRNGTCGQAPYPAPPPPPLAICVQLIPVKLPEQQEGVALCLHSSRQAAAGAEQEQGQGQGKARAWAAQLEVSDTKEETTEEEAMDTD
eukprot:1158175-Pelagomonas_calceolata.AAC.3